MTNRRKFIRNTAAAIVASSISPIAFSQVVSDSETDLSFEKIKPKRLKKGDTIGLITPGGQIVKRQLDETIAKLEKLGYKTYHTDKVLKQYGYFAGTDNERATDLMHHFTNKNVDVILAIRGGYGAIRILDLLDYKLIQQNPKALIGYSDITALLSAIYERTGVVTFHGPVGISSFNNFSIESLESVLMCPKRRFKFPYQREKNTEDNREYDLYTINEGKAKGELIGGNLSVIDSMIGSKFELNFKDKIVYLEEISEKTYKVDKMLVHLLQATNIKEAAGIAFGIFAKCDRGDEPRLSLKEAIVSLFQPLGIPISYGFPFGHIATKITLPTGVKAKLNASKNTLKLLEKAVE
ncbi:MAG TPA: LD-carboxypeptidase [Lutibacter sp.]|nr:LD-carboxypeptidase [Lutibacter sp.]